MKKNDPVFKQNPKLEKYYSTSDGEAFYNDNDAKNHAKTLEVKTVETVFNPEFLEVIDEQMISEDEKALAEFEASELQTTLNAVKDVKAEGLESQETDLQENQTDDAGSISDEASAATEEVVTEETPKEEIASLADVTAPVVEAKKASAPKKKNTPKK